MPTPLHNHTMYSQLDGLSRPSEIAEACKLNGFAAAACTDHGVVAGHVDFHRTMTEAGLKPILGMEAYQATESRFEKVRDNYHLLLLAQNDEGLRNLWRLSHLSNEDEAFYHRPRVDWELLKAHSAGIVCTTACMSGMLMNSVLGPGEDDGEEKRALKMALPEPEELINRYRSVFGDRFFIEVHTYDTPRQREVNRALEGLARDTGVGLVYASDAHYAFEGQHELHERVLLLQQGFKGKGDGPSEDHHPPCLFIQSEEQVREALSQSLSPSAVDEALANTDAIADACDTPLPGRKRRTPIFTPEEGYPTNEDMLLGVVRRGWDEKVVARGLDTEEYRQRLRHELETIFEADLIDYFLIVRDYVEAARAEGIPVGPGRGSVGGSLLAWLLGITEIDPIPPGLIFERFYNAGREESGALPDIDNDFCYVQRDWVKDYLRRKYGEENVGDIGTVVTLGAKQALLDCARAIKRRKGVGTYVTYEDERAMAEICDECEQSGLTESLVDIVGTEEEPGIMAEAMAPFLKKYPELFEDALSLQGFVKTFGGHPSGVIVADEPLAGSFPARWDAKNKKQWSQWDMNVAGDLGFMKMDLLGLTQLTVLDYYNDLLEERGEPRVDWWALRDEDMPEDGWKLLEHKLTVGIFQVESGGQARRIAKDLAPRSVDDLSLIVALNRPGPDIDGYMDARKAGEDFDGFIYQEEVIAFFQSIGYNLREADEIRAIMGKKKRDRMREEKPRYMERAQANGNMSEAQAEALWDKLIDFSRYAFNKAHSYGYAMITFATLYAKGRDPLLFYTAAMQAAAGKKSGGVATTKQALLKRRPAYIAEALRRGYSIERPDINRSELYSRLLEDGTILMGLKDMKGMSKGAAEWIVKNRGGGYASMEDFEARRTDPDRKELSGKFRRVQVSTKHVEILGKAGAFRGIAEETRPMTEILQDEHEVFWGCQLSENPGAILEAAIDAQGMNVMTYDQIDGPGTYVVAGVVKEVSRRKTSKGDEMAFCTIEREDQDMRFAIWKEKLWHLEKDLVDRATVAVEIVQTDRGPYLSRAVAIR